MAIVTGVQVKKEPFVKGIPSYDPTELLSQRIRRWEPASSLTLNTSSTSRNILTIRRSFKPFASRARAGHDLPPRG